MSPVRKHFWLVVARVNSTGPMPRNWFLNWFIPAGVNRTVGSSFGTNTSVGRRTQPLDSKNARYFSRSSSVFMFALAGCVESSERTETKDLCNERGAFQRLHAPYVFVL